MAEMTPIVKEWYDRLEAGELRGLRCGACGRYEFPPVPICNGCGSTDLDWVEMSGDAELISFSYAYIGIPPFVKGGVLYAHIKLAEGPVFVSWIPEVKPEDQEALLARLPAPVTAEILEVDPENHVFWPVFHLKDTVEAA